MPPVESAPGVSVNVDEFKAQLQRDGYVEVAEKSVDAGVHNAPHSHPFAVRALVTAGEIALTSDGTSRTYRTGDVFTMAAGCEHAEQIGAQGVTYVVGRRHPG
jgi:quercetin dioxygenase-like cupin family protein